ncbi:4-demethylwyosine synthase TYW1 [Candidatus Pacearchaeota archaeon]|nr:4-demethylwyosine synthase TYW1 [Candidatus Pacearchaeota archaeon]
MKINKTIREKLEKEGYRIIGSHSAIKVCLWCKNALRDKGVCYKNTFYGIESWRCIQMSCSLLNCTSRCLHCWRDIRYTEAKKVNEPEEPKKIVDGCIKAQKEILQGFKGTSKTNIQRFKEAMNPKHFALSLAGESFFYPLLAELIDEIHKRGMTSFLVSNGQLPEKIKKLEVQPTQFYISLNAPNKKIYQKMCRSLFKDAWERLNKSLEIMPTLNTRKVLRMTLVRDLNMTGHGNYARLIKKAAPDFIEVKGYMSVGFARQRLGYDRMPNYNEVKDFAKKIAALTKTKILDEKIDSRVFLLGKNKENMKIII